MGKSTKDLLILFRSNLVSLREKSGISQSELGRRIKSTPSYVCDLERGRRAPNLATLAPIADALGVHPSELISKKN
jgi:transcriptional regulator with XRE-family HTH domain